MNYSNKQRSEFVNSSIDRNTNTNLVVSSSVEHNARVYIQLTSNNTILTLTDPEGKTLAWSSCGSAGFKGGRKNTAYAAQTAADSLAKKAHKLGVSTVRVILKGLGKGRDMAVRGLVMGGLKISRLEDRTPVPHNGCRPPKKRRI